MSDSYIEQVLNGTADVDDIDDFVDAWHDGDDQGSLHDYLGLRLDEYYLWVEKPIELESIISRRREKNR